MKLPKRQDHIRPRRALCLLGMGLLLLGGVFLFQGSVGYEVYYEDTPVGFVSQPDEVLNNVNRISISLSQNLQMQAVVRADQYRFEKRMRVFRGTDDWPQVAEETEEKCQVDVNRYEIAVDDQVVVCSNDIGRIEEIASRIQEDYEAENPEETYTLFGFAENVAFLVSQGKPVEEQDPEELYQTLREKVTVETVEKQYEQTAIPFDVIYEDTDTRPLGEKVVQTNGVEGAKVTETVIVRHDGEEISRDATERVLAEPVNEVILVGTLEPSIPWDGEEYLNPVQGVLTSRTGQRWGRLHKGIDIGAPMGQPIYAAKGGVVVAAGFNNGGYGNMVEIDHGDGTMTLYAHMSAIETEEGAEVLAGELIGLVGSTGRSTGPHLHFEVIIDGVNVDPLEYVAY